MACKMTIIFFICDADISFSYTMANVPSFLLAL